MGIEKTIIITSAALATTAKAIIDANWRPMAESGHPMAVRIYEHKERRSLEQQSLMWIRLGEVASQAWVAGRQFNDEVWHRHFKREFLPDEEGPTKRCRKGYRKWDILPSGERDLVGSTTQLTTFGMAEYMTQIEAYASTELGVRFSVSPYGA